MVIQALAFLGSQAFPVKELQALVVFLVFQGFLAFQDFQGYQDSLDYLVFQD